MATMKNKPTSADVARNVTQNTEDLYNKALVDRAFAAGSIDTTKLAPGSEATAEFQVDSTTKGFLPPRMTTAQRDAITSPAAGLMIYNTTTNKLNVYTTTWEVITSA